ncbi:hypothetical protein GUJ93_ZPchr0002g24310 [Zizania palustris]|uniref:Uncharacterized protein n=1 Tax=Zizania palustris TaxID=103762 RepID=A0A8J5RSY7_ZIZPA|nr:hypothetical protein GUJ93_ZPchr0002g24310 [Zizania palustris]
MQLPPSAIRPTELAGVAPDVFCAHRLLASTGIAVVAGSGFHPVRQESLPLQRRHFSFVQTGKRWIWGSLVQCDGSVEWIL